MSRTPVKSLKITVENLSDLDNHNIYYDYFWLRLPIDKQCIKDCLKTLGCPDDDNNWEKISSMMAYEIGSTYKYTDQTNTYTVKIKFYELLEIDQIIEELKKLNIQMNNSRDILMSFGGKLNIHLNECKEFNINNVRNNEYGC